MKFSQPSSLTLFLISFCILSCTDMEEETFIESDINTNLTAPVDPQPTIDNAYNALNGIIGDQANINALSEVTTDAAVVPTRGTDWDDNGIWRQLHQHTWTLDHPFVNTTWDQWNNIHCQMSQVIEPESNATTQQLGDAHFLRALASYVIIDNFGQIVRCEPSSDEDDTVLTESPAVDFIINELELSISNLPEVSSQSGSVLNKGSKAAARYLLAKVLLNKHVYLGTAVDPTDMESVIELVDDINDLGFDIEEDYFNIFRESADNETIWYLNANVGNRILNGLHYNQAVEETGGGWNGFATLSEYYDLFEGNPNSNRPNNNQEERRGYVATEGTPFAANSGTIESIEFPGFTQSSAVGFGFLEGQQFAINCAALTDRTGAPLAFERNFTDNEGNPSLENNSEVTGIRVIKYHPQYGSFTSHQIFFRYSDAHLMKAEAVLRSGGDPTPLVNELRSMRNASEITNVTEQDILDERGRELYIELWRRNDLIRFGKYTDDWELKDPSTLGNSNLEVFPIPSEALMNNPNLQQNPGY